MTCAPIPAWYSEALCAQTDPERFFPSSGDNPAPALAICRDCPVRAECLAEALSDDSPASPYRYGIWGGTTASERRDMQSRRKGGAA